MYIMATDKWANPQKVWDERFSQADPVYGERPNTFLTTQASRFPPGAKLLVPGDGYGRNGIWLAQHGFDVHTVDLSAVGVERARQAAQAAGVQMLIEQADLSAWHWPLAHFDGVFAIFVHLPPQVRSQIHASMLRAVKPGGLVILEAFSAAQLQHTSGGPKQVDLLYTPEMLREDFVGAEIVELEAKETEIQEGHLHSGLAAVVQAIFRR
jgi:SAM-dependent methyltransferase